MWKHFKGIAEATVPQNDDINNNVLDNSDNRLNTENNDNNNNETTSIQMIPFHNTSPPIHISENEQGFAYLPKDVPPPTGSYPCPGVYCDSYYQQPPPEYQELSPANLPFQPNLPRLDNNSAVWLWPDCL